MPDDYTTVGAPDGSQIRFPVSMSDTDIEAAMGKLYPAPSPAPKPSTWEKIKTGASDIAQGVGEGVLQPVATTSRLLNKIPYVGETLAPKAGVDALSHIANADPGHPLQNYGQYLPAVASLAEGGAEASAAGKLVPFLKRAATSAVGGAVGSELGGSIGRHIPIVGGPTLGEAGEVAGGLAGTLAGGGAFGEKARNVGNPREIPIVGKYFRKLGFPDLVSQPGPLDATRENIPYAGETTPPVTAGRMPTVEQAATPAPSIRRTPGQIAPETVGAPQERVPLTPMTPPTVNLPAGGTMRGPQPLLPATTAPAQASAGLPSVEGPAKPTGSSLSRLEALIREAAGTPPPLDPAVPLREQPRPMTPARVSAGQQVSDVINKNTEPEAVRPLAAGPQKSMTLKDIAKAGPPAEPQPHRATVVHEGKTFGMEAANGRKMYEATKGDTGLANEIHNLSLKDATKSGGATVQNAFLKAGGDVNTVGQEGQRYKAGKTGNTERIQMFDWMLDKGLTPRQIVDLAKQSP